MKLTKRGIVPPKREEKPLHATCPHCKSEYEYKLSDDEIDVYIGDANEHMDYGYYFFACEVCEHTVRL